MRTGLGVDARVGYSQALHRASIGKVLLDDFRCVFQLDAPVPDGVRIDYDRRAVFALVKTHGLVDADAVGEPSRFGQLLKLGKDFAFSVGGAGWAGRAFWADIMAHEDVMFEKRQRGGSSCFQSNRRGVPKKFPQSLRSTRPHLRK
jgi:hypothetical protein